MPRLLLAPLAALALSGCFPIYGGPSSDYDLAFAKAHYRNVRAARARGDQPPSLDRLSVEQVYAVHRYSLNKIHGGNGVGPEFARRGSAAVPFLRERLQTATSYGQVASIQEALIAMQDAKTYDVRTDPSLVALIQNAAHRFDNKDAQLRDKADDLETGTRLPMVWPSGVRGLLEGLGDDYDSDFAKRHCPNCDWREWAAGADSLPIEQLYALHRYGWEGLAFPRNLDAELARRGAVAIPFLKRKLSGKGSGFMVWNILSVLERMRDTGAYDVAGDVELMAIAEAAVARTQAAWAGPAAVRFRGDWSSEVAAILDRLRSGSINLQSSQVILNE